MKIARERLRLYTVKPMDQPGNTLGRPYALGYPSYGTNAIFYEPSLVYCLETEGEKINGHIQAGIFMPLEDPREANEIKRKPVLIEWAAIMYPKMPKKTELHNIVREIFNEHTSD